MKMEELLATRRQQEILIRAEELALDLQLQWSKDVITVLQTCCNNPGLSPRRLNGNTAPEIIKKWLIQYRNGYNSRVSVVNSKPPGTIADPIIDIIIGRRLSQLSNTDLEKVKYAHRLSMSAENILGALLEEYLAQQLMDSGWYCCWGSTIRSVDFCHTDGRLLQVKNRSNTENSSSRQVREGTDIRYWYRINATTGGYNWQQLKGITGCQDISEDSFEEFVKEIILLNPFALPVEREDLLTNF